MEIEKSEVLMQFLLIFRRSGDVLFFLYARRLRGYTGTLYSPSLSIFRFIAAQQYDQSACSCEFKSNLRYFFPEATTFVPNHFMHKFYARRKGKFTLNNDDVLICLPISVNIWTPFDKTQSSNPRSKQMINRHVDAVRLSCVSSHFFGFE